MTTAVDITKLAETLKSLLPPEALDFNPGDEYAVDGLTAAHRGAPGNARGRGIRAQGCERGGRGGDSERRRDADGAGDAARALRSGARPARPRSSRGVRASRPDGDRRGRDGARQAGADAARAGPDAAAGDVSRAAYDHWRRPGDEPALAELPSHVRRRARPLHRHDGGVIERRNRQVRAAAW